MIYKRLVKAVLEKEKADGTVDVTMVDDDKIRELNKKFRKKDKPTDVLAFAYGGNGILGDVIISRDTARKNARCFGTAYREEIKRLVIHGVLHVIGYDHGRKMSHAEKIYQKL